MADVEQRLDNALWLWRLTRPRQEKNVNAKDPVVQAFEKSVKDFEKDMNSCEPPSTRQPPWKSSI